MLSMSDSRLNEAYGYTFCCHLDWGRRAIERILSFCERFLERLEQCGALHEVVPLLGLFLITVPVGTR